MFAPRELGILNEREVRDTALRLLERVGTKFAVRAISEGLRKEEYANNIRKTIISPGMVTTTEITESITDVNFKPVVEKMYEGAIDAENIARSIAFAIEQPSDVAINEMIIRPTSQER